MSNSSTSSSEPSKAFRGRWRPTLAFGLGVVVLAAALNAVGGFRKDRTDRWFGPVLADTASRPFDALFVGTSRVAASIDTHAFDSAFRAGGGRGPMRSVNLGMGYTKSTEYWFALRHVLEKKPRALEGTVVFLEAPSGIGEYTRWTDDWIVADGTAPLQPYLHPSDLPRFVKQAATPARTKLMVSLHVLFGFEENFSRLRFHAMQGLRRLAGPSRSAGSGTDLSTAGGIRVDSEGVSFVRSAAVAVARQEMSEQASWSDYDSSVIHDVVTLVQRHGGRVVFFDMPLSSIQLAPLATPLRNRNRLQFQERIRAWGCPLVRPEFPFSDEDFPDYWHLRRSRAAEFSAQLARGFLSSASGSAAP